MEIRAADFVHLHNHSDYSLLDGAASIPKLVRKVKESGMEHVALTDHGNMFGALQFYTECKKQEINPIIGSELYLAPTSRHIKTGTEKGNVYYHLVLLAKNQTGYRNLIDLCSAGYTEGFYYKPRIDDEILKQHCEGLIAMSACLAGEIPTLILRDQYQAALEKAVYYRDLFEEESFYLELQDHGIPEQKTVNKALISLSKETGIPLICSNDAHYLELSDANAQDILICIGTNKKRNEEKRLKFASDQFYLKTPQEMAAVFSEVPQALRNTRKVAQMCNITIDLPGPLLPDYTIPQEFSSPEAYLRHLTYTGLEERYTVTEEIKKRADYELDIIINMGFTGYFLIVWDFIDYARRNHIPVGPGRGSGAGSIVAYALKITDVDPLRFGLLFERFLNPERVSMPDFDIDFCYERRQEVIDYVTEKYGKDKVGQIITFGTLKARAVIRDVARVLDIPYAEADSIAKLVPATPKMTIEKALDSEPRLREIKERGGVYEELIATSQKLEGLSRHASTHAAGIVIGKEKLTNYVPLYRDPKTGAISTQYTMDVLEDCGLVKMDFLGLKTLTLIKNTVDLIHKRGIDLDIDAIPEDDPATFAMLGEGKSTCIFQFESSGMQSILKRAKPTKIEDLIALNALYRPGPMANIDQFINSKSGKEPVKYLLPELEPLLKETYGVIVYQEQVMEIARQVAGYSLGQADVLRRAMGKKKAEIMPKIKGEFIEGAINQGYSRNVAEKLFEQLIPFAGYGFNKSHATAYSVLAYKTAFLKANYPAEFMAANLTNEIHNTDKLTEYISETRGMGLEVLPPDINLSEKTFTVVDGNIVYGLMGIKNVGIAAVEEIIRERKQNGEYCSFIDFLDRVDLKTVNHKVIESLIQSGLFDKLSPGRATLFHNIDTVLAVVTKQKERRQFGQTSLFEGEACETDYSIEMEAVEEWPQLELLRLEKEHLGFYFSGHPLDNYRQIWEQAVHLDLSQAERYSSERAYNLLGLLRNIKEIQTKNGKPMAFAQLEDFNGMIELVFFPSIWESVRADLSDDTICGLRGKLDLSRGDPKFLVDEVKSPEDLEREEIKEIHIKMTDNGYNEEELFHIRSYLFDHQGSCHVYLHLRPSKSSKEVVVKAHSQLKVSADETVIQHLQEYPHIEEVWRV
jgi:DNA polymerase-3 subunit alpha